jgi:hypothetical protein
MWPVPIAGALVLALSACEDVPFLPRWDADWYVPLPTQSVTVPFAGVVPPGASGQVGFTETQDMEGAIGDVLSQSLRGATVIVTLTKQVNLAADFTVQISSDVASGTITLLASMGASDTQVEDTLVVDAAGVAMLNATGESGGTLTIQMNGTVSNPSGSSVTVTGGETIEVKIALIARIGVSTEEGGN